MCLYLYTEPVVCTCIHVHLHAQEPVGVNACVCTACGRQRLVKAISLNICPHFVLGQGTHLFLAGLTAQSALVIFLCLSPRVQIPGIMASMQLFRQLLGIAGNTNSVSYVWAASASQAEPCLQPLNVAFCVENGFVAATTEAVSDKWGLRVAAKDNRGLSCSDIMAKLFKIWPPGPTESKEWEFLTIISYSGASICNFLQMKSGVKNTIDKNDSWRNQRMSTLRDFALYSA